MTNSGGLFEVAKLEEEVKVLQKESEEETFWNDNTHALEVIANLNNKKETVDTYNSIVNDSKDLLDLISLGDDSLLEEIDKSFEDIKKTYEEFKFSILFTGKHDELPAIIDFHPGAGGTEAQDWADMLFRMYIRYCDTHNLKVEVLDYEDGDEAGLKSATIRVYGKHAYGLMKGEKGVHRLVRISPFDANKRRHTSFASIGVIPEFDDNIDIEIDEKDLRVDTYRSGGAGGQNVNKVSSAVRITHLPTGIVVSCQIERSQLFNKETCMKMLRSKLYQRELERREKEMNNIIGEQKNIEWGSQIRSYVFCPYTLVKDARTDYEEANIAKVMDGGLDGFIYSYLQMEVKNGTK